MKVNVIGVKCDSRGRESKRVILANAIVKKYRKELVIMPEIEYQIYMGLLFKEFPVKKKPILLKMYLSYGYIPRGVKTVNRSPYVYFTKEEGVK